MRTAWGIVVIVAFLAAGCDGALRLGGEGGRDGGAPEGTADAAEASDPPRDTAPEPDALPDGECCAPPLAQDRQTGTCVDPTALRAECAGDHDACRFGQLCTREWGEGPVGDYCHIPCDRFESRLCPEGYVCDPVRCCDMPNADCVPDPCAPPLLLHPWTGQCVSVEGLGMDCSTLESCNPGQDCLRYTGVDGEYHVSCEVACGRDDAGHRVCPNGYACADIDDGPGNVCRPRWDLKDCTDPGALVCGLPDKLLDVARDTVCRRCYGVVMCVDAADAGLVRWLLPDGTIDCGPAGASPCGEGMSTCMLPFRSGVDDCPDQMPSDFFWSLVCIAAKLDAVRSVRCYFLE